MTKDIQRVESQSSFCFRWGKTGDEAKLYFDDWEDLKDKLDSIRLAIENRPQELKETT